MATEYKLSYTASEIDEKLGKIDELPIENGTGEKSIVIGDGEATKEYAIAIGSNDTTLVEDIVGYDLSNLSQITSILPQEILDKIKLPDGFDWDIKNLNIEVPQADSLMGVSIGVNTKTLSAGTMALGVNSHAGCRGFYFWDIDFTNNIITLSTNQKPIILGSRKWDNDAVQHLANWKIGDKISIVNKNSYVLCSTITAIDSTNGKITVDTLPFTEIENQTYKATNDLSIICPIRSQYGVVELGYGAVSIGLFNKAVGNLSHSIGRENISAGDYSHTEGTKNIAGYVAHAEGYEVSSTGDYSHAEGYRTTASGRDAHAEGEETDAKGNHTHAEGRLTRAYGYASHAEGHETLSSGDYSHAEGFKTDADGRSSHAEGQGSESTGDYSHSEGYYTKADGESSHAEGQATLSSGIYSHAEGNQATASEEASHAEGRKTTASNRFAHAEGDKTQATGRSSHSEGEETIASGGYAHAEGHYSTASGEASHAEGDGTTATSRAAHAEGFYTKANGEYSHSEGCETETVGESSHAEGFKTNARGERSHAEGHETEARGDASHAEGRKTLAYDIYSHAEGRSTTARGKASHAEGESSEPVSDYLTTYTESKVREAWENGNRFSCALGIASHVEGKDNLAFGNYSHAEGNETIADGNVSHAEGDKTQASGYAAHAEGYCTDALGQYSHAEGEKTVAFGIYSHIEGGSNRKAPYDFITWDNGTIEYRLNFSNWKSSPFSCAYGKYSHVEGNNCLARGDYTHAEGYYTIARGNYQHVHGKYNIEDTNNKYAHIIGNGDSVNAQSNAHTLDWNGNAWYKGSVTSNGADYAEYFEWLDGNTENEDRIGLIVSLDGEKIKLANSDDEILGIISGTAAVLGDNYECEWNGKYLTDDFGRVQYEEVEEFYDVIVEIDEETNEPIVEKQSLGFFKHPIINPNYNPEQKYVNRSDRQEWDTVGMLGKLYVRDDGTCEVNRYATVGENGIATASLEKTNMRVLSRVNDNVIKVLLK